ncbi:MAG: ATP-dependent DNA helicase RecG [Treponema sp.]|jgi:ATP-dependent DNA helicase RecG|nr:ATP-dependent DNA helicase RecG [Treponema sp.]
MFLRELNTGLDHLKGVRTTADKLHRLALFGIIDLASLLRHYPRDWEDRCIEVPLRNFQVAQVCTVVRILAHDWSWWGSKKILHVFVEDETARATLVCYKGSYLGKELPVGGRFRIWGSFTYKRGEIQAGSFEYEALELGDTRKSNFGAIIPVYPLSDGLSQDLFRRFIRQALDQYAGPLEDEIPGSIIKQEGLLPKAQAIRAIHFPQSMEEKDLARRSLIYEELFYLEVMVGKRALERKREPQPGSPGLSRREAPPLSPLQSRLLERLPFKLTAGQVAAVADINRDISGPYPMARLLQGDVGSGKTLVSFIAALGAVDSGGGQTTGQAAIMAPTELLARQHAENAARLLEPLGVRIAFLTGNVKAAGRNQLLQALAAGEIDIVVGTHALFSRDLCYRNLRLVVIDEQHRFGVTQRQAIMAKGDRPGLLMMSATPIPRTLAFTVFGDLDLSEIRDMPPGRKPIKTHLASISHEARVYDFVRRELAAGCQAYFVYPLIEAADRGSLKDAETMAERLSKQVFPQYPTALIHSRLDEEKKRITMEAFRMGELKILVATSVVEVGVDVPNATCMVIEHAERFGLSALHQLRGRVGRGSDQSYCFLVYSDQLDEAAPGIRPEDLSEAERTRMGQRLMVMKESTDGFLIAEKDLKFRGPGQIAGIEQSGYLSLGLADPVRDAEALARARSDAFAMLEADPGLLLPEHHCVAEVLSRAPPFRDMGM